MLAGYTFSPTFRLATVPPDVTGLDFEAMPPACTAGATVFFDDFSNANSGWGEQNIAAWYRHYINGEYEAMLKVNTELISRGSRRGTTQPATSWSVPICARSTHLSTGIVTAYGSVRPVWVNTMSSLSAQTPCLAGTMASLTSIAPSQSGSGKGGGTSSAVNMGNGVNTLRVHRCGSRHYFFANNTLLTALILPELANQPLTAGYYARASQNATYRLDSFGLQTAP